MDTENVKDFFRPSVKKWVITAVLLIMSLYFASFYWTGPTLGYWPLPPLPAVVTFTIMYFLALPAMVAAAVFLPAAIVVHPAYMYFLACLTAWAHEKVKAVWQKRR